MISAREDYLDVHQHDLNCSGGSGLMVETMGGNKKEVKKAYSNRRYRKTIILINYW
jgi:hypothetical protein